MTMQPWISKHLSKDDADAIEQAVALAESKTSGEIVPMIVRRSVSTRTAPYLAMMAMLSLLFVVALLQHFDFANTTHLIWLAVGVVASLAVAFVTPLIEPLQKFFTVDEDDAEAAFERAQLEFYTTGIPSTDGRSGILIFVSLFERRAFILGDHSISERMSEDSWVKITQDLVDSMKKGDFKSAYVGAISAVGDKLAKEFPLAAGDRNELHNHLVIKE
ncbi:MAG: TPM domain-containing protein [Bdellovibrionota bacterium]